jgi:hypothetical protein
MSNAFTPLQTMLYTVLSSDPTLMGMLSPTGVTDQATTDSEMPLVHLAGMRSGVYEGRTSMLEREEVFIDIEVWVADQSWIVCNAITKRVNDLIFSNSTYDYQGPPAYRFVFFYDGAAQVREPDGERRHETITYRVLAFDDP